ncbi:MAG: hypothetical protein LBU67_07995 [Oscillospiraceae bacterium]|nr:hypothetical protein [Oscillospiraceae bacterium]
MEQAEGIRHSPQGKGDGFFAAEIGTDDIVWRQICDWPKKWATGQKTVKLFSPVFV